MLRCLCYVVALYHQRPSTLLLPQFSVFVKVYESWSEPVHVLETVPLVQLFAFWRARESNDGPRCARCLFCNRLLDEPESVLDEGSPDATPLELRSNEEVLQEPR